MKSTVQKFTQNCCYKEAKNQTKSIRVAKKINSGPNKFSHIDSLHYYVPIVDGKEYSYIAETEDVAYIIGLQIKYDGLNSQFTKMACRMLNINTKWAE